MNLRDAEYVNNVQSDKITDRRKGCKQISTLLADERLIETIRGHESWRNLIYSLQICMRKDAEKLKEDAKKKTANTAILATNSLAPDLLIQIINIALKEGIELNISELLGYIIGCMQDNSMKNICGKKLLLVLQKNILSDPKSRSKLLKDDWPLIYNFLKNLIEEMFSDVVWNCFMLLIKYGPICGLSSTILREEFDYMTKFCKKINRQSPRIIKEDALEIALNFCEHMAKDKRIACCKFGEELILTFFDLYEVNGKPERLKELLVEFFLLQMIIHHPNGVSEGNNAVYAHNWNAWKKLLQAMYSLLIKEINLYFKSSQRNSSFFKDDGGTLKMCNNLSRLFVELSRQIFLYSDMEFNLTADIISPPSKRQKREFSLTVYIENIQNTKCWLWVHLLNSIIEVYPDLIGIKDYIFLLQTLCSLQIKSNEHNLIEHIYVCLSTMLFMEKSLDTNSHQEEIKKLWIRIGAATSRAFGLNQHKCVTEKLLQQLLLREILDFEDLIQTYQSGLISFTSQTITTFDSGLRFMVLNDLQKKNTIMRCILRNNKDYTFLYDIDTAKVLVKLTFKQYPMDNIEKIVVKKMCKYKKLKLIYLKTLLDENILSKRDCKKLEVEASTYDVDIDSRVLLERILIEFLENESDTEELLLSKTILLANVLSCLIDYRILSETDIDSSPFIKSLENILNKEQFKNFSLCQLNNERDRNRLIKCLDIVNILFSLVVSDCVMVKIKESIPMEFIRSLFMFLNSLQKEADQKNKSQYSSIKISLTKVLSNYACIYGSRLNQNQNFTLEILSTSNYNFIVEEDYILVTTFLKTIKLAKPGVIPDSFLDNILSCFQELAGARYHDKAEDILGILCGIYPHIAAAENFDNKIISVCFLKPFYERIEMYGPEVSISFLQCLQTLCELDPEIVFSRWADTEVVKLIPKFLKSEFQEVRFKAVDVLVTFYDTNSENKVVQEEMFNEIYETSKLVLEISENVKNEKKDEVLCRTASVLLTYISIANCDNWVEESLYYLIKIAHIKNIEQVDDAFKIINKWKLGNADFNVLENYVLTIVEKWISDGYDFNNFPYNLFKCATKYQFYEKYFEQCAHFLIIHGQDDIGKLTQELEMSEREIIKKTAAKIFARIICNQEDDTSLDILTKNHVLSRYYEAVGYQELKTILKENLDLIVIGILDFLIDEKQIKSNVGSVIFFRKKYLSAVEVQRCLQIIEKLFYDDQPLGLLLTEFHLSKLESIFLQLKSNFYKTVSTKDKLRYFHRYEFIVNLIVKFLHPSQNWKYFFLREVVYTLLNMIENNKNNERITSTTCKFLTTFLKKILPNLSETFRYFLHDSVNALRKFHVSIKNISSDCKDILEYLKSLAEFKDENYFEEIESVQGNVDLKEEIVRFLKQETVMIKENSLVRLRKVLAIQKDRLLRMYESLQDIRGFSEDCQNSWLHRLVCVLAQLSYSENQKVSFAAARCLGELGPANLQTLVLRPEKMLIHEKCTPFEIILGTAISLLSKYLTDCDIVVIQKTSEILYTVLGSNEGRKNIDSGIDFDFDPIHKNYIIPYITCNSSSSQNVVVDSKLFLTKLNDDNLWCSDGSNVNHSSWIRKLVTTLLETFTDKSFLRKFAEISYIKVDFSESLLSLILYLLVSVGNQSVLHLITKKMDHFFTQHWKLTKQMSTKQSIALNKKSVKSMLNVVNYTRLMKKCNIYGSRLKNELNVDYLKVAKAAEFCENHFSALYYCELWCQERIEDIQILDPKHREKRSSMIDNIYEIVDMELGETLHNILRNAYKSIGDLDALPGCGTAFLLQPKYRVEHYKEQGKMDQVIQFYANEPSTSVSLSKNLLVSLKNYGLYKIPAFCSQLLEPDYESMWRLSSWSFEEKKTFKRNFIVNYEDFEKYRFECLKSLNNSNLCLFREFCESQYLRVTNHVKNISLESTNNLYPILTKLQCQVEMEDFSVSVNSRNLVALLEKWKLQDKLIRKNDFQYVEPIVAQRLVMLMNYLNNCAERNEIRQYLVDLGLDFAGWSKDEGFCKEGLTVLENLKRIPLLDNDTLTRIDLLDAQLSWSVNNTLVSMQILNRLCKSKTNENPKLKSIALKLTGQYMSETHSENRTTIISDYFLTSVTMMGSVNRNEEDIQNVIDTYDKLALFAHKEYQQIMTYMKSDLFQKKISTMQQAKKTVASLQKQRSKTNEERKAAAIHDKNSDIDDTEIRTARQESNQFLKLALKFYLLSLVYSDTKNIRIFQIIALFLENRKNDEIAVTIEEGLLKLPSHKFIVTLPQLVPHLTENDADLFSTKVKKIILKCAKEHPHHTLPLLLSLVNAYQDKKFTESKTIISVNDTRVTTAKNFIAKLKKDGLENHISKLDQVSCALIDLAYFSPTESNDGKRDIDIPRSQKIMAIKNFGEVLVPTCILPVRVGGNYLNIIGISSFKSTYEIVGGVNKPKKIHCRGTDGKYYSQLVKGQDDLRQDAVMQQVFTIMNDLLSYNKSTKHLRIRTYKIVPLSMRSGILKWADNSMPIGEYLTGGRDTSGAHQTYRPKDKSPNACREAFKKGANRTADIKLNIYTSICRDFKPVFHHFFEHYFPQPALWYERRRAYIHSVATTSMCGYMLGIGDRHTSNILIDKKTAEVIHIDFGIAFEQGRVLPTPETVPFRLTRDIVDGMGASGVEGIFRRSCEKTMEVLRQNSQTIITILEVLLYDPLYVWTVTSAEANKRQTDSDKVTEDRTDSSEEPTNVSAERALLRLREKLQGIELGYPRSIEHQVGTLIQQAIDPENLCKLFVGWQPYL